MIMISKNGDYNDYNKQNWQLKIAIFAIKTITENDDYNETITITDFR